MILGEQMNEISLFRKRISGIMSCYGGNNRWMGVSVGWEITSEKIPITKIRHIQNSNLVKVCNHTGLHFNVPCKWRL